MLIDIDMGRGDIVALKEDLAGGRQLKKIQRAQVGRFSGTGGPDDNDDLALTDLHIDTVERFDLAVLIMLFQVVDPDQDVFIAHSYAASSR